MKNTANQQRKNILANKFNTIQRVYKRGVCIRIFDKIVVDPRVVNRLRVRENHHDVIIDEYIQNMNYTLVVRKIVQDPKVHDGKITLFFNAPMEIEEMGRFEFGIPLIHCEPIAKQEDIEIGDWCEISKTLNWEPSYE